MAQMIQVEQIQVESQPQPPMVVNLGGGIGGGQLMTSLYVGDLDGNVTDGELFDLFNQFAPVVSVRVCRDLVSGGSLGYGYVNYDNSHDAARALEVLNFTLLKGKPIRIMYSNRDPSTRQNAAGNIFIKNLAKAIDQKSLHATFSAYGQILSCKVATDDSGQSRGYGFVQYDSEEAAQKAIRNMNGLFWYDKKMFVGPFLRKEEREIAADRPKYTNVFVKNLSKSTTEEDLQKAFGDFGRTTSVVVMRDGQGKSKCFGFVNFENPNDAARSIEALNGHKFGNKKWYVGRAQKKSERDLERKYQVEESVEEAADGNQGLNLYVKNIDSGIDDDKLKELFSPFGTITSCKVIRDPLGVKSGSGFVSFSTPEEASNALAEMNGKVVVRKPLCVAYAQMEEDRRASLQDQGSEVRPIAMASSVSPRMPIYPRAGPGLGQQVFYRQTTPTIIPRQMPPRGQGVHVPPMPLATVSSLLHRFPEHQRLILGNQLYPQIEQLQPEKAPKITGMFLEMSRSYVLRLLYSPEALTAAVAHAMEVLRDNNQL